MLAAFTESHKEQLNGQGNEVRMDLELNLYTGTLTYRDIDFTFVFDREKLHLIPPKGKRQIIEDEWKKKEITKGAYIPAEPITVEDDFCLACATKQSIRLLSFLGREATFHIATLWFLLN